MNRQEREHVDAELSGLVQKQMEATSATRTSISSLIVEMEARINVKFSELEARVDVKFSELEARVDVKFSELEARIDVKFAEIRADIKVSKFILYAVVAGLGALYWQMFEMNGAIVELSMKVDQISVVLTELSARVN